MFRKILFTLLTFFLFAFSVKMPPVLASHTIEDQSIEIEHSPNPLKVDSGSVTVTVKSTRDIFDTNQQYTYRSWVLSGGENSCPAASSVAKPISAREFRATWGIANCSAAVGRWKLQLWAGVGVAARNAATLIVNDYQFSLEQAGGKIPTVSPRHSSYQLGDTPVAVLSNAIKDNVYSFWWEGSLTDLAAKIKAPNDGVIDNIQLEKKGVSFNIGDEKKLCMEIGDVNIPWIARCRIPSIPNFKFSLIPPPPAPAKCEILPPNPPEDYDVSIKATGVEKNSYYRADLQDLKTSETFHKGGSNSDSNGVVVLALGKLKQGNYKGYVYNAKDERACPEVSVPVGPPGGAPTISNQCDPKDSSYDPKKCSKAGGVELEDCSKDGDPKNPGIATAIGCIHTKPEALVKDFLTFTVAVGGGIAFLMMLLGAYGMITSAGNPDALKGATDRFTDAIIGLLFVIFAVLLMQIIGVGLLKIPGFIP